MSNLPDQSDTQIPANITTHLVLAQAMADAAADVTLTAFRSVHNIANKSAEGFDPVTQGDKDAEAAMRAYIAAQRPDDGIIGEEDAPKISNSGYTWILDPIDGTRAFMAGLPVWTTLIGLVDKDNYPILGLIDQPYLGERYIGWNNGGFWSCRGVKRPLRTKKNANVTDAILCSTDPFLFQPKPFRIWTELQAKAAIARYGLDAYGYAAVSVGGADAVIETGLAIHDMAALFPVIRGAGGLVTDWTGQQASLDTQHIVAVSNKDLLDNLLPLLAKSAIY